MSDLDFTLLDSDGNFPLHSAERLNSLITDGMKFTVATARAAPSIRHLMADVDLKLPIIELNGAIIRDLHSGQILEHRGLGVNTALPIYKCFMELGVTPYVSALIGDQNPLFYPELNNPGMQWFLDEKIARSDPRLTPCPKDLFNQKTSPGSSHTNRFFDDILTFTYLGPKPEIEAIAKLISHTAPDVLITTYPNHYIGDWEIVIAAADANKGNAINRLLKYLTIDLNVKISKTTAFGDSSNDLEMLNTVDHPIAVSNASTEIKASAREIIGHHKDGAVIDYLEKTYIRPIANN
ncbi:HAD hydrolase family protein [Kiloniella antarctica]|uniref:HAD hydrolase family protein n=1 Tax=Kiloniella antarctica TaxID=1550907 RepID=A0ABW5BM97_9PROT